MIYVQSARLTMTAYAIVAMSPQKDIFQIFNFPQKNIALKARRRTK
jgi:hypothetical protein